MSDPCEHDGKCYDSNSEERIVDGAFICQYWDGLGNDRAVGICNPSSSQVDASQYQIHIGLNGQEYSTGTAINLYGYIEPGQVLVVCDEGSDVTILDNCDIKSSSLKFNGDDAVGLFRQGTLLDSVGEEGFDPGTGFVVGGELDATANHRMIRRPVVMTGNRGLFNTGDSHGREDHKETSEWSVHSLDDDETETLGVHAFDIDHTWFAVGSYRCQCHEDWMGYNCDTNHRTDPVCDTTSAQVSYGGYNYQTLYGAPVAGATQDTNEEQTYRSIPSGFAIAPDEDDIVQQVIAPHTWDAWRLCTFSKCWAGQHYAEAGTQKEDHKMWETNDDQQYRIVPDASGNDWYRILIRAPCVPDGGDGR
jgi:hypothetical protein